MSHVTKNISSFTQQDITHLLKNAHVKARTPGLRVLLATSPYSYGRILVITPRHSGNAVKRNKIRRRLKALFYQNNFYKHSYDCVVIVKKEGILTSFEDLRKLLTKAFFSLDSLNSSEIPPYQS